MIFFPHAGFLAEFNKKKSGGWRFAGSPWFKLPRLVGPAEFAEMFHHNGSGQPLNDVIFVVFGLVVNVQPLCICCTGATASIGLMMYLIFLSLCQPPH